MTLIARHADAHIHDFRNVFASTKQDDTNLYQAGVVLRKVNA